MLNYQRVDIINSPLEKNDSAGEPGLLTAEPWEGMDHVGDILWTQLVHPD